MRSAPGEGGAVEAGPASEILAVTAITLVEVDGNPKRSEDTAPSMECYPPTRLEGAADQEEREPTLELGERWQEGGESRMRNGMSLGMGVGNVCEVL